MQKTRPVFLTGRVFAHVKKLVLRQRLWLPLMRELSAKLTEGEMLNSPIYIFTYTAEIAVNIQITDSDY